VGYQLKGDSYRDLGRPADALAAYQSGVDNTPGSLALVLNYYTLLQAEQGPGKALTFLEDIVRRQAETVSFTLLRVLAAGYTEAGEPVKSIALHETLLKSRPNDPILLNNLALAYFENGDDRARDVAQKAYDLAPDNYAVMDTLGWILVNAGDASVGVTLLRNALARSANVPDIRYHYAVALNRNGQTKTAARELQSLLSDGQPFTEREAARALYEQLRGSGSN
ncbi:MAG: tetratricopeptide repeat protein, partial [Pseudomonadales bacterium]|nr:tetratricopeptide repeat protein [Pseudomonadales bacterium]